MSTLGIYPVVVGFVKNKQTRNLFLFRYFWGREKKRERERKGGEETERVQQTRPGWPWTDSVAENDLELAITPASTPQAVISDLYQCQWLPSVPCQSSFLPICCVHSGAVTQGKALTFFLCCLRSWCSWLLTILSHIRPQYRIWNLSTCVKWMNWWIGSHPDHGDDKVNAKFMCKYQSRARCCLQSNFVNT